MDVRWVVTHAVDGWADERNLRQPRRERATSAGHLDEVRPDVVHIHSLQSLGAGLVPVARAVGRQGRRHHARLLVVCARQFLVDPSCGRASLVVDAGECACEVDRRWLRRAARRAARRCSAAPTWCWRPSASAAEVLAGQRRRARPARGRRERPARLDVLGGRVGAGRASPRSGRAPVRFVYTGGPQPDEGRPRPGRRRPAAAPRRPGWTLTAYGLGEHLDDDRARPRRAARSTSARPFAPDELDRRPAPTTTCSCCRRSCARRTRSPPARRSPRASRCCAPTPSVPRRSSTHGVNGLVVPGRRRRGAGRGDAPPRRATPARSTTLRAARPSRSPLRSPRRPGRRPRRAGSSDAASSRRDDAGVDPGADGRHPTPASPSRAVRRRHRGRAAALPGPAPGRGARAQGVHSEVRHYRDPDLLALGGQADVVVVLPGAGHAPDPRADRRAARAPASRARSTSTTSSSIPTCATEIPALRSCPPDEADAAGSRASTATAPRSRPATPTSAAPQALVDHAATRHRAADPPLRQRRRPGAGPARRPRAAPAPQAGPAAHRLLQRHHHPRRGLVLRRARGRSRSSTATPTSSCGSAATCPTAPPLDAARRPGACASRSCPGSSCPALLRDLDVNLAPLAPGSRFNEAKSAIKWLEAALVETPTVATPTEPFREAIDHGDTGLLAVDARRVGRRPRPRCWTTARPAPRIGARARRRALLALVAPAAGPALPGASWRRPSCETLTGPSGWVPVAHTATAPPLRVGAYGETSWAVAAAGGRNGRNGAAPGPAAAAAPRRAQPPWPRRPPGVGGAGRRPHRRPSAPPPPPHPVLGQARRAAIRRRRPRSNR